ncbi:MAG: cobalt-precorrin-6A reductase [Rhodobiaceae bacterium]|nr:cobalt-precorrin-6A reductase [Rhodobiaceae bacterium]
MPNILIIGGIAEANKIACHFINNKKYNIILSLAGRTINPRIITPNTRIGGFGGTEGLENFIHTRDIALIVDATHPYATNISRNAIQTSKKLKVPIISYIRREWKRSYLDNWIDVKTFEDAIKYLPKFSRTFLSLGKQNLDLFSNLKKHWFLIRTIDKIQLDTFKASHRYIYGKGPFTILDELLIMKNNRIDYIITRNSGGNDTYAKILAARYLKKTVIVIKRPKIFSNNNFYDTKSIIQYINDFN